MRWPNRLTRLKNTVLTYLQLHYEKIESCLAIRKARKQFDSTNSKQSYAISHGGKDQNMRKIARQVYSTYCNIRYQRIYKVKRSARRI